MISKILEKWLCDFPSLQPFKLVERLDNSMFASLKIELNQTVLEVYTDVRDQCIFLETYHLNGSGEIIEQSRRHVTSMPQVRSVISRKEIRTLASRVPVHDERMFEKWFEKNRFLVEKIVNIGVDAELEK